MKTIFLMFLTLSFAFSLFSQEKATDREFEGYKGQVKSVLTEYVEIENSKGKIEKLNRFKESEYFFEEDGRLAQILYPEYNNKLVFKNIDGFKTYISSSINPKPKQSPSGDFAVSLYEPPPIEKPEKLVSPDKRFDEKYAYEYDSQGRVKIEREYENNGRMSAKTEFKYNEKSLVIEEKLNDTVAVTKFTYKYDSKGNLIEKFADRNIKGPGIDSTSRTVYSDYKLDEQGNWIERKSIYYFEVQGRELKNITTYYRTIIYY